MCRWEGPVTSSPVAVPSVLLPAQGIVRLWSDFGPEEHGSCEVLLVGRMSSSMFWSALHLKGEMALGIIHGLKLTDQLVKDVDRARLENWWQGRFGKDYGDELAEWMKLTVLWWKLSLLFQTQCLLSGIMNAMAVPGLEMCMGSSNHCWGSRSPVAGPILSWWYTPCSQEDQPTTCRKKITLALPGHWGSSYLTFLINIILDLDLSSLLACFLSVPSFGDLVNAL